MTRRKPAPGDETGTPPRKFTMIDRDIWVDMYAQGIDFVSVAAFNALLTSTRLGHSGLMHSPDRAVMLNNCPEDRINEALNDLHHLGVIVYDRTHHELLLRSRFRRDTANKPNLVRAAATDIDKFRSNACLAVLASEILRTDLTGLEPKQQENAHAPLSFLWASITGARDLPPAGHLNGDPSTLDRGLWKRITALDTRQTLGQYFAANDWANFSGTVRPMIRTAFEEA